MIGNGEPRLAVEVKSGHTVASDFFKGLRYWRKRTGDPEAAGALIHGGDASWMSRGFAAHRWSDL